MDSCSKKHIKDAEIKRTMAPFEEIKKEELKAKLDAKEDFILIDVRGDVAHEQEHIPGAISVPHDNLEPHLGKLDKGKLIIAYCGSYECPLSKQVATKLEELGYNVKAYEGGIKEWRESGYPSEGSAA